MMNDKCEIHTQWFSEKIDTEDAFPRPNWDLVNDYITDNYDESEFHKVYCCISKKWLEKIALNLSNNYAISESENFIFLCNETERYKINFLEFLEHTLVKILDSLKGIANDDGYGKHVVIIFDSQESYYSYISYFYPEEGEYSISSGMFLDHGYGHFVFPRQESSYAESIAAHEMTHAVLGHLTIPTWLNEGMAMSVENAVTGSSPLHMDNDAYNHHQSFWRNDVIQEFLSGKSFDRTDEGNELSYQLAQFLVYTLSKNYNEFKEFVNQAEFSDGGESAAMKVYGCSLTALIEQFLGLC